MGAVSVVVTVRDEAAQVPALLAALAAQTRPADEIVVVDGGSTDGTVAALQAHAAGLPLQVLEAPGANIAAGRNRAIAAARHDLLAVTDAGCLPRPDWLACLLAPFAGEPGADLVAGSFRPAPGTAFEDCVGRCSTGGWLRLQGQWLRPSARSLAFTRAAWSALGGFPEQVYAGEDSWFILTLARRGFCLHTAPGAMVDWRPRSSYRAVLRQFYLYTRDNTRMGLAGTFYGRTLLQDALLAGLAAWGLARPGPLPWLLLLAGLAAYLARKARQGCFDVPGWRTLYRVPLILATIHLGVVTGLAAGLVRRAGGEP